MRFFFLLLLFLYGCSSTPLPKNTLRISFSTHPTTFDPRKAADYSSSTLVTLLYEGLTRCTADGGFELALAQRIEISRDEKTYWFHLRNAFWSDGKRITAYDFERSWKEILSGPAVCSYLFYPIRGAENYVKKEGPLEAVGITALGELILQVELERPTPYFLSLTAFPTFFPAPLENDRYAGPFTMDKMVHQTEIVLKKNLKYWNADQIALDEIQISILPDEMTALQLFERGDLDWLGGPLSPLPPDAIEKFKDQITYLPNAATTFCTFNTQTFPFSNKHLRKAFSFAINRKEIVEKVTQSGQNPATTFLPLPFTAQRVFLDQKDLARFHFQKALKELNISASDLESLCLYYKPSQLEKRLAQTLQKQWKEVLGITIGLAQFDFKSYMQRLETRNYQLALAAWIAQFNDPISILERFKDVHNLKNYPGWSHPPYTRLLQEALDSEQRALLLEAAIEMMAEEIPLTPIYHWSFPTLCNLRVEEGGATPCGGILFERFKINEPLAKKK